MKRLFIIFPLLVAALVTDTVAERPNIVWIIPDDMSANFSCYGETAIETPNVDKLAADGVKFTNAYVTAPVCSTCTIYESVRTILPISRQLNTIFP
jgi:hypothetical protein